MDSWKNYPGYVGSGNEDKKPSEALTTFNGSPSRNEDRIAEMEKQSKRDENTMVRQRLEEFACNTTLHGMNYVGNSQYGKFRRYSFIHKGKHHWWV